MKPTLALACAAALWAGGGALVAQVPLTTVRVAGGLDWPLLVTSPPDDPRLFVVERGGRVKVIEDGVVLPQLFLDVSALVSGTMEQGFLGLAFHPDYASTGSFYVSYTDVAGDSVVARYQVSATDPGLADPASGTILLTYPQPEGRHNGGGIAFGPDGYLYLGLGDGGGSNDPSCFAQSLAVLYGKLLRIDVDGARPYAIPPTNPFVGTFGARGEIWHLGLRNPWRWSFDRATGDLYLGDVGQNAREEIDFAPAGVGGLNFGWSVLEGTLCNAAALCRPGTPPCGSPVFEPPIVERTHSAGTFTAVGGYVYRGCAIPSLVGTYFWADFVSNQIESFRYDPSTGTVSNVVDRTFELAPGGGLLLRRIVSLGEDAFGELYFCDAGFGGDGEVYKLVPAAGFVDCDGDFHDDACEIAADPDLDLDADGQLDRCQAFSADTGAVSASGGGVQNWSLHAGPAQAGRPYLVAGSLNGTAPGIVLPAGTVPLNYDAYFLLTLTMPNTPPLVGSLGLLDAQGQAAGAFDLSATPLPPGLVGGSAHHAYATWGPSGPPLVSNPLEVRFEP